MNQNSTNQANLSVNDRIFEENSYLKDPSFLKVKRDEKLGNIGYQKTFNFAEQIKVTSPEHLTNNKILPSVDFNFEQRAGSRFPKYYKIPPPQRIDANSKESSIGDQNASTMLPSQFTLTTNHIIRNKRLSRDTTS